jgi:excisionase family DNA binding protein
VPIKYPIVDALGDIRLEPCLNVEELATLLGASDRTVRRRVNCHAWPYVRGKGGRILFTREHVRLIVAAFNESHDYPAH